MSPDEERFARAEATWALAMAAVACIAPWLAFYAVPPTSEIDTTDCTLCVPWWAL